MMALSILDICVIMIATIAGLYLVFCLFCKLQGDERVIFRTDKRTAFEVVDKSFDQIHLMTEVPYKNKGKQNGTIMDCFARTYLPQEQFDSVKLETWVCDTKRLRDDNYWESVIIEKNQKGKVQVHLVIKAKHGNIRNDAAEFPHMGIDIMAQIVGRSDWHITKTRLTISPDDVKKALEI